MTAKKTDPVEPERTEPDESGSTRNEPEHSGTPEGYEAGFAALGPAGAIIAYAREADQAVAEGAAAGHPAAPLVAVLLPSERP